MELHTLALLSFLLAFKHSICDLAIQRLYFTDKSNYWDKVAHLHYFHHAVGSFLVGFIIGPQFAFTIAIIDYVLHWHIDYYKTLIRKALKLEETDYGFWVLQTADQAAHFLTYYCFLLLAIWW